jgi:Zn-dependent M28 family amino/carboxypeptidase
LRFIAWGSEELGLIGSLHYGNNLEKTDAELDSHKLCVNLDVQGAILGQNLGIVFGPSELTAAVKLMSKELGVIHDVSEDYYGSDGEAMALFGIPAINFGRIGPSRYLWHTPDDSLDMTDDHSLGEVGSFVEVFLTRLVAEARAWPFAWVVPEEKRKDIIEKLSKVCYITENGRIEFEKK